MVEPNRFLPDVVAEAARFEGFAPSIADTPALSVRPVTRAARSHVLAHLATLSETDRRMRFMRLMSDPALATYVAAIDDGDDAIRLGVWTDRGVLVAMVEGFVYASTSGATMEVAFTTDPAWRRQGLAEWLSHAIVYAAATRGIAHVVACCEARNTSMRALLAAVRATSRVEDGEVNAEWPSAAAASRRHGVTAPTTLA